MTISYEEFLKIKPHSLEEDDLARNRAALFRTLNSPENVIPLGDHIRALLSGYMAAIAVSMNLTEKDTMEGIDCFMNDVKAEVNDIFHPGPFPN